MSTYDETLAGVEQAARNAISLSNQEFYTNILIWLRAQQQRIEFLTREALLLQTKNKPLEEELAALRAAHADLNHRYDLIMQRTR